MRIVRHVGRAASARCLLCRALRRARLCPAGGAMARPPGAAAGDGRRGRRGRYAVAQPVERLFAIRQRAAADRGEPARRRRHHRRGRRGAREAGRLHAVPRRGRAQRRVAHARQAALRPAHRLHADHPRRQPAGGRADPADTALHDAGRIHGRCETAAGQVQLRLGGPGQLDASVHGLSQQPCRDRPGQRRLSFGRGNADVAAEGRGRHRDHHALDRARSDQGRQGSRSGRRLDAADAATAGHAAGRQDDPRLRRRRLARHRRAGRHGPGAGRAHQRHLQPGFAGAGGAHRRSRKRRPPTSSAARRSSSTPSSRANCKRWPEVVKAAGIKAE